MPKREEAAFTTSHTVANAILPQRGYVNGDVIHVISTPPSDDAENVFQKMARATNACGEPIFRWQRVDASSVASPWQMSAAAAAAAVPSVPSAVDVDCVDSKAANGLPCTPVNPSPNHAAPATADRYLIVRVDPKSQIEFVSYGFHYVARTEWVLTETERKSMNDPKQRATTIRLAVQRVWMGAGERGYAGIRVYVNVATCGVVEAKALTVETEQWAKESSVNLEVYHDTPSRAN